MGPFQDHRSDSNNNSKENIYHCFLCGTDHDSPQTFAQHKITEEHCIKYLKYWYQKNRKMLTTNKGGVEITVNEIAREVMFDEETGTISVNVRPGNRKILEITLENTCETPVLLYNVTLLHDCDAVALKDDLGICHSQNRHITLPSKYVVECLIQVDSLGVEQVPIAFYLCCQVSKRTFHIVRTLQANGVDQVGLESGPTSLYRQSQRGYHTFRDFEGYVPGIRLIEDQNDALPRILPLDKFPYPESLRRIVEKKFVLKEIPHELRPETKKIRAMLDRGLSDKTHQDWFKILLWMEEMQMEFDIAFYNMKGAKLTLVPTQNHSKVKCVELQVPGLAEKRPSVLKGDSVYLTEEDSLAKGFEGIVHKVNEKSLYLALSEQFMSFFIDGQKVDVEFSFSRHTLKVCHRALALVEDYRLMHFLYPMPPRVLVEPVQNILLYNKKMEDNHEQLEAVRNIISGSSKPAPYIVFGPPGTGKTVTVVEAIKQIYKREPHSRVLVCAPSNAACDNITLRLQEHISSRHILRMHSKSREISAVPLEVRVMSNIANNMIFFPSLERLLEYRVVVCTLIAAAKIATAGVPSGSISHVFIEECGQAMEPEALVGIGGILAPDGQLVLSGDPHQLGPVIRNSLCFSDSHLFKNYGLDKSFLERLMEWDMYQPVPENRRVVTKLLKNYRSHKDILKLPNDLFYKSELQACADPVYVTSLCDWEFLPQRGFPLIFHGVKGKDEREGSSPSFFNAQEVTTVIDYVKKLVNTRHNKVLPKDIGIITPYRQQVTKIRMQVLKLRGGSEIKVGSPEEFQGDERRVIIISTVRANADKLAYDLKYQLGFLRNCKRFNVAVTRAKALLIVVGCPEILGLDEHWGALLDFIIKRGGYCGKPYSPEGNRRIDQSIQRNFSIVGLPPEADNFSARLRAEEPAWREE